MNKGISVALFFILIINVEAIYVNENNNTVLVETIEDDYPELKSDDNENKQSMISH